MIGASLALSSAYEEEHCPRVTGGSYLLSGRDCPDHTGYNDFEVWEGRSPGFSVLPSASAAICLLGCAASHIYVHCPMAEKEKLAELLRLIKVAISAYAVLVGHGYMWHE